MSQQITEAFASAFASNFIHLAQQTQSRFERAVNVESNIVGSSKSINRLGARTAQKRLTRHGDTPINDQPHSTRYVDLFDWEDGDMIDDQDKVRLLAEPGNDYIKAMVQALNRAKDKVIADAMLGAARTSSGTQAMLASQQIAVGGTGLTRAKLVQARKLFRANEADEVEGGDLYLGYGAEALEDLLNDTTLTNSEYNTVLSLQNGTFTGGTLFGFKPIPYEGFGKVATTRSLVAWEKAGITLGIGANVMTKVAERPDKSFGVQYYAKMSIGAVRVEETRVVQIDCTE